MILLFLGPPGAGKDTQANIIKEKLGFKVVSTGQLIRDEIAKGTKIGKELKETYDKGKWAPDELTYTLLMDWVENNSNENIIMTGAVRTPNQVKLLEDYLNKINKKLNLVLYFQIDDSKSFERISIRLEDPKTGITYDLINNPPPEGVEVVKRNIDVDKEAFKNRLSEVHKNDTEILEAYKNKNILYIVDASRTIPEINSEIVAKIKEIQKR